jgi:xanthine dehydrogenase accessory factor
MDDIEMLRDAIAWHAEGRKVALATVVATWGSAPRPIGSLMAVDDAGRFAGSVSGGCVEAAVVEEARAAIAAGRHREVSFGVSDETAWSVGLPCGGRIRILIVPLRDDAVRAMRAVLEHTAAGRAAALVTDLATGRHSVHAEGEPSPSAIALALSEDACRRIAVDGSEAFVRVFSPPWRLIVVGAAHIAQALIPLAEAAGYAVTVVDPRPGFAARPPFEGCEVVHAWPDEALAERPPDARTAVAVLSHDARLDDAALAAALRSRAFYVGALGSRKNAAARIERLNARGLSAADVQRIRGPIGLAIGARTPAEIAVAILAEIIAVRRGAAGA